MAPIHALIDKSVQDMNPNELRAYVQHLRTLRTSPPSLRKALLAEEENEELEPAKPKRSTKPKAPKVDLAKKLLEDLGF